MYRWQFRELSLTDANHKADDTIISRRLGSCDDAVVESRAPGGQASAASMTECTCTDPNVSR